jgi:autotransporter-associated beta strand protein
MRHTHLEFDNLVAKWHSTFATNPAQFVLVTHPPIPITMKPKVSNPLFSAIAKHARRPLTAGLLASGITLAVMMPTKAEAVVLLTGTSYTQNFNTIGTTATASLPTGWKMTAAGDTSVSWADGTNVTATTQAASSGSPTSGGRYNWGDGSDASDRAIGFMTSGSYASPNSVILGLTNNTGSSISAFNLAFDYERYRINSAAAAITFFVSSNGSDWTAVTAGDSGAFSTGTSAYNFTTGTVINKSGISVSDLSIANGSSYYFRWNFNTTGGNSQGLGLDNFDLTATLAAGPDYFWLGSDTTRGGSGTWANTGGTAWSTTDVDGSGTAWDSSKTATFNTAAANVTVDGTVNANNGLTFAAGSNGSTITGGTAINLGGATIADNTITTAVGVTATIGTDITGTTGMTKSGDGILVLNGDNTYSGGTSVTAGTLVAANDTALGSGAVEVSGASLLANAGITVGNAITVEAVTGPSQVVAYWNFNSYDGGSGPIAATSGSGSISLAGWTGTTGNFSGSSINAISPDVSGASLSLVNNSGNGSYIQISGLDFTGLINAQVSYATQRTSTGFNDNQWSYSTDGSSFTDFGAAINPSTSFALASVSTTALNNAATGFLRYTLDGASNSSQNNRIDNLQVTASSFTLPTLGSAATSGTAEFSGGITLDSSVQLTSAAGGTVLFSGDLANGANGAQGIIKIGAGTVELTGANTYTGATQVNAGTLIVNNLSGSATGSGGVTLASGAVLGGAGTISGAVTVNGIIAPGNSIGTLNTGSVTWNGAATGSSTTDWQFELGAGDSADLLNINGNFSKGSGDVFRFDFGGWNQIGLYELVAWTGSTTFSAADFDYINLGGGHVGTFSIDNGSLFIAIPEPSTALAGVLLGLGLLRRRRRA